MRRIYFDPATDDPEAWREVLLDQTPDESGVWGDIEAVKSIEEADYQISINYVSSNPASVKTLLMTHETPSLSPECRWASVDVYQKYPLSEVHLPQVWRYNKTYDELKQMDSPEKSRNLSWVVTNKGQASNPPWFRLLKWYRELFLRMDYRKYDPKYLPFAKRFIRQGGTLSEIVRKINSGFLNYPTDGHIMRMKFLDRVTEQYPDLINVYGWGTWDESAPYYRGTLEDKWDGLAPYRYSLAIPNHRGPNYFLKVTGPLLAWCMPITWGCTNLSEYLPEASFVKIDIEDENAPERIKEVVESDLREKNLDVIAEARRRILDEYQYWPMIEREIKKLETEQSRSVPQT